MNRPLLVLSLAAVCGISLPTAARQGQLRTVYISVLDSSGMPVPDLRLADLVVTEDDQTRQVSNVERATVPARLALIVEEHELWSGSVRASIKALVTRVPQGWQVGLFSAERPELTIVDFTNEPTRVLHAIEVFTPITLKHDNANVHFEALVQDLATQFHRQEVARPIILAMTPQRNSSPNWDLIIRDVLRSRTSVFAACTSEMGLLVSKGVEVSGGRAEIVLTEVSMPTAVSRILDDMVGQFAVTYISPTAPRDGFRLRVRVNRPNTDVRAPERVY